MTPAELAIGLRHIRGFTAMAEGDNRSILMFLDAAIEMAESRRGFSVDLETNIVRSDDVEIHVTPRQAEVAQVLAEDGTSTWKRLITSVYGSGYYGETPNPKQGVYAIIHALKKQLLKAGANHCIKAHHDTGYRLCRAKRFA